MAEKLLDRFFAPHDVKFSSIPAYDQLSGNDGNLTRMKRGMLMEVESNLFSEQSEFAYLDMHEVTDECVAFLEQFDADYMSAFCNQVHYHSVVVGKYNSRILSTLCFEEYNQLFQDETIHQGIMGHFPAGQWNAKALISLKNFHIPQELFRSHYLKKLLLFTRDALKQQGIQAMVMNTSLLDAMHFKAVCQQLSLPCDVIRHYKNESASHVSKRTTCVMLVKL